jgi:putative membrane protein
MKELFGGVNMMHHYGNFAMRGMGPMYWGFMGLHLLVGVLVVIVLFWLYKRHRKNSARVTAVPTALDILKKRYARGEITQEEFNNMKEHIK